MGKKSDQYAKQARIRLKNEERAEQWKARDDARRAKRLEGPMGPMGKGVKPCQGK